MRVVNADGADGWFVRAAAVIGDLSNPFYREERQRDVWNEASAVALQVLLWMSWLAATAAVWIIGAPAVPYAWAMIAIIAIAVWIAVLYARSLGVDATDSRWIRWPRMIPYLALLGLFSVGLLLASEDLLQAAESYPSLIRGFVQGAVVGAPLGLAALVVGLLLDLKRSRARKRR
ncbi:hypothetical protein SAMN06893096_10339 [Geodermatophilus pulveris]|uniref:Uncharacterized protein n=1 Tax=Geodermatophilus pulveris TaxID=1564159 RepID=A0A239D8P8_9ACTN|nr:hypothetical protein SAMN06893096_10339 [Geodermatophilus pulveris]